MSIISDRIVITRKNHRCGACMRVFPKGSKMKLQVNTYVGEIATWRECMTCREILKIGWERFADIDGLVREDCIGDSLDPGQTPEDLLKEMKGTES